MKKKLKMPKPPDKAAIQAMCDADTKLDGKQHKHRWQTSGTSLYIAHFQCSDKNCDARVARPVTPEEAAWHNKYHSLKAWTNPDTDVHRVWHKFNKKFKNLNEPGYRPAWKMRGYELMMAVEKWAEEYPDYVTIVNCDDSYHSGSRLVIFEHKAPKYYMGTTVIFIPQCTGEPPTEFFLYPEERSIFIRALQALNGPMRKAKKAQKAFLKQMELDRKKAFSGPFLG